MAGPWKDDFKRLEKQRAFCKKYRVITVLKGAYTSVAAPEGTVWFNATGNPGMATAGAGDVLTGLILGFLAQNIPPHQAALLGVWLHGTAGDAAREKKGERGLLASDLANHLPEALQRVEADGLVRLRA